MMKRTLFGLIVGLLCVTQDLPASPDQQLPSGQITNYGIYAYSIDGGHTWVNPLGIPPKIRNEDDERLVVKTDRIPLAKKILFAFEYELSGLPEGTVSLDWTVKHPQIRTPDGSIETAQFDRQQLFVLNGRIIGIAGYVFEHDYELVPGEWTLSYSYQGKVLIEKTFTVYRDDLS